jgi:hypothetical protein
MKDTHTQISADLGVSTLTHQPKNITTVERMTIPTNKTIDALNNMNPSQIVDSLRLPAFTKKNQHRKLKELITPGINL